MGNELCLLNYMHSSFGRPCKHCNYDQYATVDDGSCGFVSGCLDPLATNYDITATCDDGSCVYPVYGCIDATAMNVDTLADM